MCLVATHICSLEVVAAVLEMANGLHVSAESEVSGGLNDGAVNEPLISGIIDLREGVVVSACNCERGCHSDPPEAEEVCHVHEPDRVERTRRQVESCVANRRHRVKAVILQLVCFRVVHDVCERVVLVSQEVIYDIGRSLIEAAPLIPSVSLQLVCIHEPVNEGEDGVLEGDPGLGRRVDVERHMLVTLDVHEFVIDAQKST